jgi:hypothetical protein
MLHQKNLATLEETFEHTTFSNRIIQCNAVPVLDKWQHQKTFNLRLAFDKNPALISQRTY